MKKKILVLSISLLLCSCAGSIEGSSNPEGSLSDGNNSSADASSSNKDPSSSTSQGHTGGSSSASSENSYVPSKMAMRQTMADYIDNNVYAFSMCPNKGEAKLLVIPVWFTDSKRYIADSKKEVVRSDIEKAYFGSETETGWQSVKTYYETLSMGSLSLDGTVSDWYECGMSSSQFYSETSGAEATTSLVDSAVSAYFSSHPKESRKDYDRDGDGYLDGVMLIYGAPDYDALNKSNASNLWAYTFWLQDSTKQDPANPGANVFFWASYDFLYSSGSFAQKKTGSTYGSGDTSHCLIDSHTFIHEMGHTFGLDDYYDYSGQYLPAGGFSMQDMNVGSHDPYSVLSLGWADPYIPTQSCSIDLKPFSSSRDLILLSPNWNDVGSPFDEYLLLEFYTPTGLNEMDCLYPYGNYSSGPSSSGLRVWHVDARLAYLTYSQLEEGAENFRASQMTSDAKKDGVGVTFAFSNTYRSQEIGDDYLSPLGKNYSDYNLLQLIRNDALASSKNDDFILNSDLFGNGDTFRMSQFANQFVKKGKMNSGSSFPWEFTVSLQGQGENAVATVTLVKKEG